MMDKRLDVVTEETENDDHGALPILDSGRSTSASPTSFRHSRISIAVDVSGSTHGEVLEAESQAIRSICTLVPRNLRPTIKILSWSDEAGKPKSITQLDSLVSAGGTDPSVLIQDPDCRYALQESSFWFLLTDGLIESQDVRRFAKGLLEYGLHGIACVISIFGDLEMKPSDCNITVGLSVFAVSPHTAFLYTDVESGKTFVLQTKGCFSALLPCEHSNPTLDHSTSWDDLPQMSFENLSRISISPPQKVGRDEVILNDSSKLNVASLLQNLPEDENLVAQVLDNEDNLKTIALTAKVSDQSDRFQSWLDKVDHRLDSFDTVRPSPPEHHPQLLADVDTKINLEENDALCLEIENQAKMKRRRKSSEHARRLSTTASDYAGDNIGSIPLPPLPTSRYPVRDPRVKPSTISLCHPGFQTPDSRRDCFVGKCNLCASNSNVMALLLRIQPERVDTPHFPAPGTRAKLIYPLTMGNYPETDIVSSSIVCDPCSYRLVRKGKTPQGETLVSALPMVSFNKNKEAWLETVNVATHKRFHQSDIPVIFLSILYTKMERLLGDDASSQVEGVRAALEWVCNMLLAEVLISRTYDPELDRFGIGVLHEVLLRNFRYALLDDDIVTTTLLEYPLDGFIVANVALSNSKHKAHISGAKRKRIVFLRFLYHLTERYHDYAAENEEPVVQAAKALLLRLSDPIGPRSLLRWDVLRGLSVHFQSNAEFRQWLSQMTRKAHPFKLAISVRDLAETPFLSDDTVIAFQRLGVLFNWISSQATHATAAFLHHLLRSDITAASVRDRFEKTVKIPGLKLALAEPGNLSARAVEEMIKDLPQDV